MNDALDIYQFDSLCRQAGLIHAIFGRAGGVSLPPFESLNVGGSVGDDPQAVAENHQRVCHAVGVDPAHLVNVRQVHSDRVRRVTQHDRGRLVGELDALITDDAAVPLILRFADCAPIILYDPEHGALGVAHAGWRGSLSRIAQRTALAMSAAFGTRPTDLLAGIGPSIGACCYEVGPEVVAATRAAFGNHADQLLSDGGSGRSHLDLWSANRLQLRQVGVEQIEIAGICTACQRARFFSHRGDAGRTGRFPLVAALR